MSKVGPRDTQAATAAQGRTATLVVDVGNSRIKWASYDGQRLAQHGEARREQDFARWADFQWQDMPRPAAIIVSNVAGAEWAQELRAWSQAKWAVSPAFLQAQAQAYGVTNAYHQPERLGVDRWAALIAARALRLGAVCIVDCGTALTIDVMTGAGAHLGGLIMPGLNMMRQALTTGTRGIALEALHSDGDIALLARDTADAVRGGTLYMVVAAIDRVIADVSAELKEDMSYIITGGDAATLLPLLAGRYRHEPDLVLQGLAVVAESLS